MPGIDWNEGNLLVAITLREGDYKVIIMMIMCAIGVPADTE